MFLLELLINENLLKAEVELNHADSDTIIECCRNYQQKLTAYRDELYKLRGVSEISLQQPSALARELTEQVRKAIRSALEITTRERNQTELLLESFISINGYKAAETFNQLKYHGFDNWELKANSVRSESIGADGQMSIQEAVDTAGRLRREAYVLDKTTFSR